MNAVEFMVGDWAYYGTGTPTRTSPSEIFYCQDCEPIPITLFILKRNGFRFDERYGTYYLKNVGHNTIGHIQLHPVGDSGLWILLLQRGANTIELRIEYVHELQHALRLAKIDKEIEL